MSPEAPHLTIQSGPDTGRDIRIVDPAGVRVGRSSKNDVVLNDDKTSRHHCRFFLRPGDGLWVCDLGSANQTIVNGESIREVRLKKGDLITLGDTVLRVTRDEIPTGGAAPSAPRISASVDLGLGRGTGAAPRGQSSPTHRRRLWMILAGVILLAGALWLWRRSGQEPTGRPATTAAVTATAPPQPVSMEIAYEKVLGDTNRLFRYHLSLDRERRLAVRIDDTVLTHHEEQGTVTPELVAELAHFIEHSGFLALNDTYQGLQPNVFDQWDLEVTLGPQVKRVRVVNRAEPEAFKTVRERLEQFAQMELGLWAVQYPPEQLVRMAHEAYLDGRKRFDERQVADGNLAMAIRRLRDAEFFLRTIEPKPDFYPSLLAGLTDYAAELDRRYVDQNFLAIRALRAREWDQAAVELRRLCTIIGDRSDPRYEEARRNLLEVESRLQRQQR